MMKLNTKRDGTILGATIVGHRAGQAIAEVGVAMNKHLTVADLALSMPVRRILPTCSSLQAIWR